MQKLIVVTILFSISTLAFTEIELKSKFSLFKAQFNKRYDADMEEIRYDIFKTNVEYIEHFNTKSISVKLGVGPFADLTYEEFSDAHLNNQKFMLKQSTEFEEHINVLDSTNLPSTVDWGVNNKVTQPEDQGDCIASYIFASVGTIESAIAIQSNTQAEALSKQEVLDCSKNLKCSGGLGYEVYDYLIEAKCIATEEKYEYVQAVQKKCKKSMIEKGCKGLKIIDWNAVVPNNELQIMAALSQTPLDAAVFVSKPMQHYKSGVIPDEWCTEGQNVNHEVMLIGYDDWETTTYWVGRNSWGPNWGIGGYFMIERNVQNYDTSGTCNVASQVVYPVLG